jgi:hypothetical protein
MRKNRFVSFPDSLDLVEPTSKLRYDSYSLAAFSDVSGNFPFLFGYHWAEWRMFA